MSQKLFATLEGLRDGKWLLAESHDYDSKYQEDRIEELMQALLPIHTRLNELRELQADFEDPDYMPEYLALYGAEEPLKDELERLLLMPPLEPAPAFMRLGPGYEFQAIMGLHSSIRACEDYRTIRSQPGIPADVSKSLHKYIRWFAIDFFGVHRDVTRLLGSLGEMNIVSIDVKDFLAFDWQQMIKRFCFVSEDLVSAFGDGEQRFPAELEARSSELKQSDKLMFAAWTNQPQFRQVTFYSTYAEAVGEESLKQDLARLKAVQSRFEALRLICWVFH